MRAWHETFGLPIVMSNCSNNYGPYHFPEKLIPLAILKALHGEPIPVYGKSYNVGGDGERTNLEVVRAICALLDELAPGSPYRPHAELITFVADRPGHDQRYAMDATKIQNELGWQAQESFDSGLRKTVAWYLDNRWWWEPIWAKTYRGARLGTSAGAAAPAPANA